MTTATAPAETSPSYSHVGVKERPLIFSGPMVVAVLDGRKTRTRRIVKPQPTLNSGLGGPWIWANPRTRDGVCGYATEVAWRDAMKAHCPYGKPGDRLWVKETFRDENPDGNFDVTLVEYAAGCRSDCAGWTSSRFMPRRASRISLDIADVRVARLQEIDESDAEAEGIAPDAEDVRIACGIDPARHAFARYWNSLNAKRGFGWAMNPWVWVIIFKRLDLHENTEVSSVSV